MRSLRLGLLAAAVLAPNGSAAAPGQAAPAPAAAGARWISEWAHNQCNLVRESGGAANAGISLQLVPGTQTIDIVAAHSAWTAPPVRNNDRVSVVLDGGPPVISPVRRLRGQGRFAVVAPDIERSFIARFAAASSLRIERGKDVLVAMALPASAKAVAALKACEEDALKGWGVDPHAHRALRSPPTLATPWWKLVSHQDYPSAALAEEQEGTSVLRLTVEADGKVSNCGLVSSSGSLLLDRTTCAIYVRRARFNPAVAADGKPVRSLAIARITWRIQI